MDLFLEFGGTHFFPGTMQFQLQVRRVPAVYPTCSGSSCPPWARNRWRIQRPQCWEEAIAVACSCFLLTGLQHSISAMHFLTGLLICQASCTHETTDIPESWAVGSIPNTSRLLSSWNRQSFVYLIYSYLLLSRHIIEPPMYRSSARIVISHMGFSGKENENAVPRFWLDLHGLFWRGLDCWDGLFNSQNSHQNTVGFRGWLLSLPG